MCNSNTMATMKGAVSIIGAVLLLPATGWAQERLIATRDQNTLSALYYSPERPGPAAVIFRNCDAPLSSVRGIAERLRSAGFHALAYDYRRGLAAGKSWRETREADLEDVHAWLIAQPGIDTTRLVSIGGSCGAELALAFAQRFAPHVRGVVVMSGPSRPDQHAFIGSASAWLAVLGIVSIPEGAPTNIDDPVNASTHPATAKITLRHRAHGTFMLDDRATADSVISCLLQRIR